MIRVVLVLFASLMFVCGNVRAGDKPRMVVGITLANFYPEWVRMYDYELGDGGFKRLMRGAKELRADYGYMYSQSGTDQATIYTGTYPSEHGIISHEWYDRLKNGRLPNISKDSTPEQLRVLNIAAYMRMANSFSRAYSVAMRAEDALMAGGTYANNCFWFDEKSGKIVSSKYNAVVPQWLDSWNIKLNVDSIVNIGWLPSWGKREFYYNLSNLRNQYRGYQIVNAIPHANDIVINSAIQVMRKERLGEDREPDLLMITLSSLDYMNRDFAINSPEFKDLVLRMDKSIETLLKELDSRCGEEGYTLFMTVSEGREMLPIDLSQYRLKGDYFSIYRAVALLKSYLKLLYGDGDWVLSFDSGQIYLNRELIQKNRLVLGDFQRTVADFLVNFEGVAKVITSTELASASISQGTELLISRSFYPKRSGDIMFALEQSWIPGMQEREDSYCRYSKCRFVPLYVYGVGSEKIGKSACSMIDIFPTICRIVNLSLPYNINGVSLME